MGDSLMEALEGPVPMLCARLLRPRSQRPSPSCRRGWGLIPSCILQSSLASELRYLGSSHLVTLGSSLESGRLWSLGDLTGTVGQVRGRAGVGGGTGDDPLWTQVQSTWGVKEIVCGIRVRGRNKANNPGKRIIFCGPHPLALCLAFPVQLRAGSVIRSNHGPFKPLNSLGTVQEKMIIL